MPIDESLTFLPVNIAVLTVSDTRDLSTDRSGETLQSRIEAAGHRCIAREILRDEADLIEAQLRAWIADAEVDAVRERVAALLSPTPVSRDEVVRAAGAPTPVVLAALTELALAGRAELLPGGLVASLG